MATKDVMTKTAETGATAPVAYRWRQPGNKHWIYDPTPEWIEDHKHEIELEPLYLSAVNRDARFTDMVGALEHALVRFRCLEDQFEESGDTASWAMCSVDADRMEKILSSIKASTS